MTIWLTILGMAAVSYMLRAVPLLLLRGEIAPWLRRWLDEVPVAVFTALIIPALVIQSHGETNWVVAGPALPAGIVGALVAWRTGNMLLTLAAGMLTFWLLRLLSL
jgi:branched-subunit amino acid transport protein